MIDNSLIYEKYRKLLETMLEDDELFSKCVVEGLRWNGYNNYGFSEVYSMDELDEICYGLSFADFFDKISGNHFSTEDSYFIWDEDGIKTLEGVEEKYDYYHEQIDKADLSTYLIENYSHLDLALIDSTLDDIVATINNVDYLDDVELNEKYKELYEDVEG